MIRVADYIISFLYDQLRIEDIFLVSGSGVMFLTDAIYCHQKIKYICNHHEQAVAMSADAYAKTKENYGVALVTCGPGATNALTGVVGAWQDSTPCFFISGQSKTKQTIQNSGLKGLRQFGVQEVNILPIVESVTKFAVMIDDPYKIKYYLEKAAFLAKFERPGPVWLDIPLDIQGALIDPNKLYGFNPEKEGYKITDDKKLLENHVSELITFLKKSKRPVIIAGNGIRLSKAVNIFNRLVESINIPVITPRLGIDLMDSGHKLYIGRPGIKGDRAANFTVQNSDLILSIGSRMSVNLIGHEYALFARHAKKIIVDIDEIEHRKKTIKIDKFYKHNAFDFIEKLFSFAKKEHYLCSQEWAIKCSQWKNKYPVVLPEYKKEKPVNTYYFIDQLSNLLNPKDVIIIDSGFSSYVVQQAIKIKKGQRLLASGGLGAMGYAIPASIGASIARKKKRIICITGDGSLQMNIQELQTIFHHQLPIKIFIFDNNSYASICTTQHNFFKSHFIGADKKSGISFPDIINVAKTYQIKFFIIDNPKNISKTIIRILNYPGPVICAVKCNKEQPIIPTVYSYKDKNGKLISKPLEDMYPFLDRKEFLENMIIAPVNPVNLDIK